MTRKLTFCALLSVLGFLCLLLGNLFSWNTVFLVLCSTLFCYIATEEYGVRYGLMTYAVITLLGFLLVSNKLTMTAYGMIVGYYPVVKHLVEHHINQKWLRWVIKAAIVLSTAGLCYTFFQQLFTENLPTILLFAGGFVIFVIYDVMLTVGIRFYALRLRKHKP